jgi:tRNA (adenine57-N1/adenine58-N1)-methyltransferase
MTTDRPPDDSALLRSGDMVLLIDRKDRRYLIRLQGGQVFHTHLGAIPHDDLIGRPDGSRVRSKGGGVFLALRPTLAEFVLQMGRAATPVYPKDTGAVLTYGDIYPGATVVEAGFGSGALTIALLRAVGETGRVVTYEVRPEFAAKAQHNVLEFARHLAGRLTVRIADVYEEGIAERDVDRIVLDLPEPWRVVPHAEAALRPGGVFLSYVPTTIQLHQVWQALDASPLFGLVQQFEVILRPWDAGPQSLRPAHRMVAHTGFITTARRLAEPHIARTVSVSEPVPHESSPVQRVEDTDDDGSRPGPDGPA